MDFPALAAFLDLASQAADPGNSSVTKVTTIAGLTTLEIILMSACSALGGVVGIVWKWGNDIRRETATKLEARADTITQMVVTQTADNKDTVHAIQDVGKTLDRLVDRIEKNGRSND